MINIQTLLKLGAAVCAVASIAGCASTHVSMDRQYGGKLPRPEQIFVCNFAVSPQEVQLDSGLCGEVQSRISQTPRTDVELAIGRKVSDALASHLVSEIQKLGFVVTRTASHVPDIANSLVIQGQFLSVDEGNQAERIVIGLGFGRTDVRTLIQAVDVNDGKKIILTEFGVNARSGSSPGMAETLGVGAITSSQTSTAMVSGGAQVGTETFSANVDADADRTAKIIASQLKQSFLRQGWIL
jgi:hypothetical protein